MVFLFSFLGGEWEGGEVKDKGQESKKNEVPLESTQTRKA